mmetsp:Transcript_77782/g.172274  ORF Transcript_77782/g.172274 Transcript_77782/m.172274 type:complete len:399 (-) Transcript_77782:268-1464(-)
MEPRRLHPRPFSSHHSHRLGLEPKPCSGAASEAADVGGGLRDVPHPTARIVRLVPLRYSQVPHLKVRYIVHRDLEVQRDRADLLFNVLAVRRCRDQGHLALDGGLSSALELLNVPDDFVICRQVLGRLPRGATLQLCRARGGALWEHARYSNITAVVLLGDIRTDLDRDFYLVGSRLLRKGKNPEGHTEVPGDAIVHHRKFAVGRVEGERPLILEVLQVYALMEVAIVEDHSTITSMAADALVLDVDVLIQRQLQLGVALQVGLHLDAAIDRAVDHETVCAHQHRDPLQDVDEDLVFLLARGVVLRGTHRAVHSVARHSSGIPLRQIQASFWLLDDNSLVVNARLEVLCVRGLWIAEVHHLVKELIHEYEIFPNALLVQDAAEVLEDLAHLCQQLHHG